MSPLQRDLLHHVTGQMATVAVASVWQVPVVGIAVGGSDAIVVWLGAWSFWCGWCPVLVGYPDPCAAWHWWHTMGRRLLLLEFLIELAVLLLCLTWKHSPTILCHRTIWVQLLFCIAGVYCWLTGGMTVQVASEVPCNGDPSVSVFWLYDARWTRKVKSRKAMAKAINKKKNLLANKFHFILTF
jgi:hypothetical protein